ncbi:MAG: hypothetical protein OXG16_02260 [Rhodospirillales bacterium]|nr:hypothetical protein [Rhodospirillales bacterium]
MSDTFTPNDAVDRLAMAIAQRAASDLPEEDARMFVAAFLTVHAENELGAARDYLSVVERKARALRAEWPTWRELFDGLGPSGRAAWGFGDPL